MESSEKLVLTIEEAGKLLGLSRPTAYKLAKNGTLPTIKLGRKIFISKIQLQRLLNGDFQANQGK
jgi:excisionase family DNA binding protein